MPEKPRFFRHTKKVVQWFYSPEQSIKASQEFERVFSQKDVPDNMDTYQMADGQSFIDVMIDGHLVTSRNEDRRLIGQGGVSLEGVKISDESALAQPGILKAGKRRFLRIVR